MATPYTRKNAENEKNEKSWMMSPMNYEWFTEFWMKSTNSSLTDHNRDEDAGVMDGWLFRTELAVDFSGLPGL